ncbi:glyoxalase [Methylobacterium variabile]|uniref:Glyoxalase n=1 Tax=Methylobacterium variabile TaxID=298794 RepID=A0A0J6S3S2_9HYPH|nr:VOC family protein [Methylobacterium variabile]KMO28128.1 glyoxalase [Methylobacterium variabile]
MLHHVTLRTHDLEGTRAFFEAVLGLEAGYRPAFAFPGYWLYGNGEPVVHLIPGAKLPPDVNRESIDHVGFLLSEHDGMRARLEALGMAYSSMELPELGERRLFLRTHTGILLELVFKDTVADPEQPT